MFCYYSIILSFKLFGWKNMQSVSYVNFNGQFKYDKLKLKQSTKLNEILNTPYNNQTNAELLKQMPFDVDVVCLNPTKKAIHPRFNFWITHTKKQATLQGKILLNSKHPIEENVSKLNKFITNFKNKFDSLKGDEKLTPAEETQRQVNFILFGKF